MSNAMCNRPIKQVMSKKENKKNPKKINIKNKGYSVLKKELNKKKKLDVRVNVV